jgi:subtilisin family serine protease
MRRIVSGIAVVVVALWVSSAGAAPFPPAVHATGVPEFEEGTILIGFEPGTSAAEEKAIEAGAGAVRAEAIGDRVRVLRVPKGQELAKIAELKGHAKVRYAEPNYVLHALTTPNDPSFPKLWGLRNTGQSVNSTSGVAGADIEAEPAWTVTTGGAGVVVGVVDTGVDYNHPDLAANVWSNPGVAGCGAGTRGYNAITNSCNPMDDNNHGTHVSGTIGAVGNNSTGVVGVSWTTKIMGLKFLNSSGSGYTSDAVEAINWAINAKKAGVNLRVLNNSWGGGGFSQALLDAINGAGANGILFVAAAGNNGSSNDSTARYPCNYNASNVICVAATTQSDGLASFSNYGATNVDLGAPGTNIYSTVRGGGYAYYNGTSMATPHVSGAAALVLAKGDKSVGALRSTILAAVDPASALSGKVATGGRLNVCKAIAGCSAAAPQDNAAPAVSTVSPTENAADVPASANVSVTFSEPMNTTVTQGEAFSLVPAGGGGAVSGTFSWSGQTMTFDPSSNLAAGAQYTATVSTAAKDLAGNALASQKQWSFATASAPPPATETTAYPSSTTIESGSLRSGDTSLLAADDNAYYEVNSTTSGWTRVASLYGTFTGVDNSLTSLKASYAAKASSSCSGTASIWRFTTSSWVQLDSRSLSTSEVLVQNLVPSGTLADYVSGTSGDGDVRIRIRCTKSFSSFYLSADLVKLVSAAP